MNEEIEPKPLTKAEQAWLRSANKLFGRTPKRFEFVTVGDSCLTVIDKTLLDELPDDWEGGDTEPIELGLIQTGDARVHGVAG